MKKLMVLTMAAFAAMMPLMANAETAVVTFDANGGTVDCWDEWGGYYTDTETSWTVTKGNAIGNLPYVWYEDDDHFFTGWFDVNGNEFTEDSIVTNDMTVTARWIVDDGSFKMLVSRGTVKGYFGTCPAELTAADWPVGVTEIGNSAFYNASQLESVFIPAGVTNIGYGAFAYCYSLTNATIPASAEAIGDYAFSWSSLASVTFVGGVENIADLSDYAFWDTPYDRSLPFSMIVDEAGIVTGYHGTCPATLAAADWPEGVTAIGNSAFNSAALTSVVIPSTVTAIGAYAFADCSDLTTVNFLGAESDVDIAATAFIRTPYDAGRPFGLIVDDYDTLVGFHGVAPTNIVISNYLEGVDLTGIGHQALSAWNYNTASMTNVVVPEGVTWIDRYAFAADEALESVTLPMSLQSISYNAFQGCTALRELRIPSGVEYVDYTLFEGCTNLTVYAPETLSGKFSVPEEDGCRIVDYAVPQYTVTFNANGGTVDGGATTNYSVYAGRRLGVEGYDEWWNWGRWLPTPTFNGHDFLGWFTAAEGGNEVMAETVVTGAMTLYAHWVKICDVTFDANGGLVECYDEWWGYYTDTETSWTVTKGNAIGNLPYAWYEDDDHFFTGWFDVYGNEFTEDTIVTNDMTVTARWIVDDGTFKMLVKGGVVTGYFGSCPTELTAADWPVGVTEIGDSAFYNASQLESVSIPAGVTNIGYQAFAYCYSLTNVTIPASVEAIRDWAFSCNALQELTIPTNVVEVGCYAFGNCGNLLRAYLPKALEGVIDEESVFGGSPVTVYYYEGTEPTFATVTLDPGEGSVYMGTVRVILGNAIGTLPTPTREGFDFAGWFDGDGKRVSSGFVVTSDVTLTAYWLEASPWYYCYDNGDGVVISGAEDYLVVTNGVLTIPATLTVLDDDDDEMVTLPVVGIDSCAFQGCPFFSVLELPASIEWIGCDAFSYCRSLTNVTFSGNLDEIDMGDGVHTVFYATPWLNAHPFTFVTAEENGEVYLTGWYGSPVPTETLKLSNDVTVVCAYALPRPKWPGEGYYQFLGWYTAAEGGERVGGDEDVAVTGGPVLYARWEAVTPEWDFYITEEDEALITGNSVSLKGDIVIPASITVEEDDGDGHVTEVTYPVTAIGEDAFHNMGGIESVYIPASVTNIYNWAFENCSGLTNVVFAGGMASVQVTLASAFYGTPWLLAYRSSLPVPGNDDRENAVTISGTFGSVAGTTFNSSRETADLIPDEYDSECTSTVWYRWTAPTNGTFVFHVTDANPASHWSSAVGVTTGYDADEGCWTNVVARWRRVSVHAVEGVEYWIEVGNYWVEGYIDDPILDELDFVLSWASAPDNDNFSDAAMISGTSGSVTGTNLGASLEEGEPLPLEEEEDWTFDSTATVWWMWTAPTNGTFAFSTHGSDFDTVLGVYTGNAVDALVRVAANDQCGESGDNTSAVTFVAVRGTTYYIAVGGYEDDMGSIVLSWGVDEVTVDAGGGKTVAVSGSWLEEFDTLWNDYNGDKTAYVHSTAVNGRKVWECYVLNLDPEMDDDFTIVSFPMNADGTPDLEYIEYYPPQDDWNVPAQPVVKGAATLDGEWQTVTDQNKSSLRFFKVEVELP